MLVAIHEQTSLAFVLVPAGSFEMGSLRGMDDEKPVRETTVGEFLLASTECTVGAFGPEAEQDPRWEKRPPVMPLDGISWDEAARWCEAVSPPLRLPKEAEWEYACRAGSKTRFCFGEEVERLGMYAWYAGNSEGFSHAVGVLEPNAWGLFDMHGNLWEWCADRWIGEPTRVYRGGCFLNIPFNCRSANRSRDRPDVRYRYLGFRPAADLP
jgi:formylglycine-generating enzyme required for sulfatase activity